MATVEQTPASKTRHPFQTDDPKLKPIAEKVMAQERLSEDDALALYRSGDILAIGWLANHVRERMHGDIA
ncbi:MAG TPA: aminofutalosine synthase MqnE, partial [Candidatus Methylomirabilis sp.]|nr:aminofutalosine synthase MqnE [Candidatus Methylomirabilis sp.]